MTHDCRLPGCCLPELVAVLSRADITRVLGRADPARRAAVQRLSSRFRRRGVRRLRPAAAHEAAVVLSTDVVEDLRTLLPTGTNEMGVGVVGGLLVGLTELWSVPLLRLAIEALWHGGAMDRDLRDELAAVVGDRGPAAAALLARPALLSRVLTAAGGPMAGWEALVEELHRRGRGLVNARAAIDVEASAVALHRALRRWAAGGDDGRLAQAAVALVPILLTAARVRGDTDSRARLLAGIDPASVDRRTRAALDRESALAAVGIGEMAMIRAPRDNRARAAFVTRVSPVRGLLEQALAADPDDLWSRLVLGLLLHCEGTAEAAGHLDAAAAELAGHGLLPELVVDLRFHAGLARLRRLEGAGEADGDES